MINYVLHQVTKSDGYWRSIELEAPHERHIAQSVIAGLIGGEPRWATDPKTGRFIFGIDAKGKDMRAAPDECSICRSWHGREIQHACE